jgi:hypothetical protein
MAAFPFGPSSNVVVLLSNKESRQQKRGSLQAEGYSRMMHK